MKIRVTLCLVMATLFLAFSSQSWAQGGQTQPTDLTQIGSGTTPADDPQLQADDDPPPPDGQPAPGGPGAGPNAGRRMRYFEQFREMKMLELLDLTDQQEGPFMSAYQSMRKQQRQLDDSKRDLLDTLSRAIKGRKTDQNQINDLIDRLVQLEQQKRDANRQFFESARKILTPEQCARFVLFAERFDQTVFQRVQQMRRGMHQGGGMRQHMDTTGDTGR